MRAPVSADISLRDRRPATRATLASLAAGLVLCVAGLACDAGGTPRPPTSARWEHRLSAPDLKVRHEVVSLDFGDAFARSFLGDGWDPADEIWPHEGWPTFVWALGGRSTMTMRLDRFLDAELTLRVRALEPEAQPPQRLSVTVNDTPLGTVELTGGFDDYTFVLPEETLIPGDNTFTFEHPGAPGPESRPGDARALSAAFDQMVIEVGPRPWEPTPRFEGDALYLPTGAEAHLVAMVPPGARLELGRARPFGLPWWRRPGITLEVVDTLELPAAQRRRVFDRAQLARGFAAPLENELGQLAAWKLSIASERPIDEGSSGLVLEGLRLVAPDPAENARQEAYRCDGCSVVLVSLDTLRADHLGAYGYAASETPALDAFREDALLADESIAQAPNTLNSHASMLTGLLPSQHGASHKRQRGLPREAETLAERLADAGYDTAAFTCGGQVDPQWGLDQGFATYGSRTGNAVQATTFREVVEEGLAWLDDGAHERPFFLFLHTYEVHVPYTPRPEVLAEAGYAYDGALPGGALSYEVLSRINEENTPLGPADRAHIRALYDAEIRNADAAFGELVAALRERGLYDDTLIVFTSDHGEEFGEHGTWGWHANSLYRELMHVPLLIKLPGGALAGETFRGLAPGTDIMATVLDVVGAEAPGSSAGRSIVARHLANEPVPGVAVSQWDFRGTDPRRGWSVRTRRWKLLDGNLLDLATDPKEREDFAAEQPGIAEFLRDELARVRRAEPLEARADVEMTPELMEQLQILGYVE